MEVNRYKYFHKFSQNVPTLKTRLICSLNLIPKNIKNSDFLSVSMYDLPFRSGYKRQITQEVFEIVAISSKKPPIKNPMKEEQDEIICDNFFQKEFIKSFNIGIVYKRVVSKCICGTINSAHLQSSTLVSEFESSMGFSNFGKNLRLFVPICYWGKNRVLRRKTFIVVEK